MKEEPPHHFRGLLHRQLIPILMIIMMIALFLEEKKQIFVRLQLKKVRKLETKEYLESLGDALGRKIEIDQNYSTVIKQILLLFYERLRNVRKKKKKKKKIKKKKKKIIINYIKYF